MLTPSRVLLGLLEDLNSNDKFPTRPFKTKELSLKIPLKILLNEPFLQDFRGKQT